MKRVTMRRLGPCIAITIAVHAFLLAVPMRPAAASSARTALLAAVQTRLIVSTEPALHRAADVVPSTSPADRTLSVGDLPAPVLKRNALELQSHPVIEPAVFIQIADAGLFGVSLPGIANEEDQFLVRSLLSAPPVPLAPVIIDYPNFFKGEPGRYVGELTLFIDESGAVVRIKAEGTALPEILEDAARSAFRQVRFRPGELAEHGAVKSRIRVEVVFESGAPLSQS
jgi:hypothetical protein